MRTGDIVKFKAGATYKCHGEYVNLMGSLGLFAEEEYDWDYGYYLYKIILSVDGDWDWFPFNKFEVLTDEQVANIDLKGYFHEVDLKEYRGNRDEEPLKPTDIRFTPEDAVKRFLRMCKEKSMGYKQMPDALSYQVGGSHYKDKAIQPVQYIQANHLSFLEGCIVKRITRHRDKLKALDICKARQECDLILQLEYGTTFDEVMRQQEKSTKGE